MPVNYKEEVYYSLKELSEIFKVPPGNIKNIVTQNSFYEHQINSKEYLQKDDLDNFVEKLLLSLGLSHGYYEIPEFLKNCTSPWAVTLVKMYQDKFTCPASISPIQGDLLRTLVVNIAPKQILEIGCYTGVSTVWLAAGLEQVGSQAIVHSVDLFMDPIIPDLPSHCGYLDNPLAYAQKSVDSAQLSERVEFHKMNSIEMGENFAQLINQPIDLLFIDGDHTITGFVNDFRLFYPHVSDGGYIVLHDIYPEVCGYYGPRYIIDNFIKKSSYFELVEIKTSPINFGMAVIRKTGRDRNLELYLQFASRLSKTLRDKPIGEFIRKNILKSGSSKKVK